MDSDVPRLPFLASTHASRLRKTGFWKILMLGLARINWIYLLIDFLEILVKVILVLPYFLNICSKLDNVIRQNTIMTTYCIR